MEKGNKLIYEQLEKLYLDDKLKELSKKASNKNLFKLLSINRDELIHSDLIANLFKEDHFEGLGNKFLKEFLNFIFEKVSLDKSEIEKMIDTYYEVKREYYHIDIVLIFRKYRWVIALENKIEHKERKNQIGDYKKLIQMKFRDYKKRIFIFLTKEGRRPRSDTKQLKKEHITVSISYVDIQRMIKLISPKVSNRITKFILEDFVKHITIDFTNEIYELCTSIYQKYPLAYGYLKKYSFPDLNFIYGKISEIAERNGLEESWKWPRNRDSITQIAYHKKNWPKEFNIILFLSPNTNTLHYLYVIPSIEKNDIGRFKYLSNFNPRKVREFNGWNRLRINTKSIPVSENLLIDKKLYENISIGIKKCIKILDRLPFK